MEARSELNKKLFEKFIDGVDPEGCNTDNKSAWHLGKVEIGQFIDWLEANYELVSK